MLDFPTAGRWKAWVAKQPPTSVGVWLKIAKKGSGVASVTYAEALDVALCFGWIDGQKRKLDDDFWLQRFVPRGPRSQWSQRNCDRALELVDEGTMHPLGQAEIDRARADGRWDAAYPSQSKAEVPEDLQAALARDPTAAKFFAGLDRVNRYAILYRIHSSKKPETRARNIDKFVTMLHEGRTIH
ncbi:MAG: hypothetical protein JWL73_1513 [Actinomycetia bacterium]|nr:hypothetical protein [Actinomycetes bacterium]